MLVMDRIRDPEKTYPGSRGQKTIIPDPDSQHWVKGKKKGTEEVKRLNICWRDENEGIKRAWGLRNEYCCIAERGKIALSEEKDGFRTKM
jgi:hypothetical protein